MNKQIITFSASEQSLYLNSGVMHYSSNKVSYIQAHFDLGQNWTGYDSVRAVWFTQYACISTVLDGNGDCIVPYEVLKIIATVKVNLVGSISDGGTLTDRITTYPVRCIEVDEEAKVCGSETQPITPSQFEQFVSIVNEATSEVINMRAVASTLPAGSDATASYNDGVLDLCRYDGGRSSTSLGVGRIDGWHIVDSTGKILGDYFKGVFTPVNEVEVTIE